MISILVIDHDPAEHARCRAFLEGMGLEMLLAPSARATLDVISSGASPVAAALVRWDLGAGEGWSGPELLARLVQSRPELPVVVISDTLDLDRLKRAHELGARDFLMKPLERDRFRDAIWDALRQHSEPKLLADLQQRLIGKSKLLWQMLVEVARIIPQTAANVLLIGENGTGKELLARAVHELGPDPTSPWVAVNLAEIPRELLESHLFGNKRGAITAHEGFFERVQGGTLFLDEIGELEATLQAKLLRVLQERTFRQVGGDVDLHLSGRLVCATSKNLADELKQGRFRADLYHRLAGCEVRIPPLRERDGDLWLLVEHFFRLHAPDTELTLAKETKALLGAYPFPGNVRELSNLIHQAVLRREGFVILPRHLPLNVMHDRVTSHPAGGRLSASASDRANADLLDLPHKEAIKRLEQEFNRTYLPRRLAQAARNVTEAARRAQLDPKTFRKKWELAELPPLVEREEWRSDAGEM